MNITRYNYEEFFLLYVDKELSAADRKAVDTFVQDNPDLQMELALLQQTILPADDIVLQKKDWLYMEKDISALQENLLLYTDDELNAVGKNAIELLLGSNATVKTELDLLQQTKLQPDMEVVFEDKQLLYHKEGGRVIGFRWWRVAAAAVLLGFGLWTGVSVYKNKVQKADGSTVVAGEDKIKSGQLKTQNSTNVIEAKPAPENTIAENTATTNQATITQSGEKITTVEKLDNADNESSTAFNKTSPKQNNNAKKPDNNLPKAYFEKINNKVSNQTTATNVQSQNSNNVRVSGNNDAVAKINSRENKTVEDISNSKINTSITAIQVVNTNDNGEENNSYLEVDNSKKRTAFGGFIRKAKRVLERMANVKTGEGVKIAGFEIALK